MPAGGSPSLPCYRMDSSDRAGYPSAATDPQRPARAIVFSAEERGGVCKRREPSLRRGWDRAAPQSRRRSFQGHGAYRAHRFGCRSAPATLITARNGGRRRSNRPVEPRMRSCWLCCVTPGALHCCRGFLRVLLGAAVVLGAGRPRRQPVCRSDRCTPCAQPAAVSTSHELRQARVLVAPGSGLGACRATSPERRSAKEMPSGLVPRPAEPSHATAHLRPEQRCRGGEQVGRAARGLGASSSRCRFSAAAGAVPGRRARSQPSAQSQWSAWWRPLTACRPWARPRPAASIPLLAPHPDPTPPRPRTKRL